MESRDENEDGAVFLEYSGPHVHFSISLLRPQQRTMGEN